MGHLSAVKTRYYRLAHSTSLLKKRVLPQQSNYS